MIPDMIPRYSQRLWPRGLKYQVVIAPNPAYPQTRDESLVPLNGGKVKWYDPTEVRELPDRLSEVATGLTTPVEFADEFGLLGYQSYQTKDRTEEAGSREMGEHPPSSLLALEDPEFRKQLARTERPPAYIERAFGEPVFWFMAHANTVNVAHDLIVSLKLKDERKLRDLLEALPRATYAARNHLSPTGAFDWAPDYAERDLAGAVREALRELINPNVRGLQPELQVDSFGQLRHSLTFTSLAEIIYLHLATRLEEDSSLARLCQRCGKPFFAADPRQRYCPTPLGKSRSVCGARAVKEAFNQRWPGGRSGRSSREKRRRIPKPSQRRKK